MIFFAKKEAHWNVNYNVYVCYYLTKGDGLRPSSHKNLPFQKVGLFLEYLGEKIYKNNK